MFKNFMERTDAKSYELHPKSDFTYNRMTRYFQERSGTRWSADGSKFSLSICSDEFDQLKQDLGAVFGLDQGHLEECGSL